VALLLATCLGLPLGVVTGAYPRHLMSRIIVPISLALVACPPLVAALGLMFLAVTTGVLSIAPGALVLPAIALGLPVAAMLERLQSQATADAMGAPDLIAGAARGIPPARLVWRHAARQSLRPVLGVYGIVMGSLFSGSLAVELVTSWPGLGRLLYDAVLSSDVTLVAGCVVAGACCLAVGNFLADIMRAIVDPRAAEPA
jgi:ABC-type dipeptide/oligopeptide/nickel transport system permease component